MWGIYARTELAQRRGVTHLIVESDSKLLIDMVIGRCNLSGAIPILIRRIEELLNMNWQFSLKHMWREDNRSIDWLANHSLNYSSFDVINLEDHPIDLQSILFDDIFGACMPKNVNLIS